jgi:branched-chain amino acid transport system permease protein
VIAGSFYGLMGVGFGLIYGVTGRFHFAYASTFMAAAYGAVLLYEAGTPLIPALVLGVAIGIVLGILIEIVVYRPVAERARDWGLLAIFVSALGVTVVVENLVRLVWGSEYRSLPTGFDVSPVSLGSGVTASNLQIVTVVASWLLIVGLWAYLRHSRQGTAIRAVSSNPDLAESAGVSTRVAFALVFGIGSLLGGVGALLFGMERAVAPDMGTTPTFFAFVVAFVAGTSSGPLRLGATGLAIGVLQSVILIKVSETWQDVVVFGIVFAFVALRPLFEGRSFDALRLAIRPRPARAD